LPWPRPVLVAGHSCVLSWWEAVKREPAPVRWKRYRDAVRCGLAAADRIVAPSETMRAALHRHYGVATPSLVIPNGIALEAVQTRSKGDFVFAAGRLWDEAKNLAT